jgi:hypothetical protein
MGSFLLSIFQDTRRKVKCFLTPIMDKSSYFLIKKQTAAVIAAPHPVGGEVGHELESLLFYLND